MRSIEEIKELANITYDPSEQINFKNSTSFSIEEFEKKFKCIVLLQGTEFKEKVLYDCEYPICAIYPPKCFYDSINNTEKEEITKYIDSLSDAELDINFSKNYCHKAFYYNGILIAGINFDKRVIFTSDFIHYGRSKPKFTKFIIKLINMLHGDFYMFADSIINKIITNLIPYELEKIHIHVTKLDKNEIKKELLKYKTQFYEELKQLYEQKINMLERKLENERNKTLQKLIPLLKTIVDNGWVISKKGFVYKEKIIPKKIKYGDSIIELPKDKNPFYINNLTIPFEEIVYGAECSSAFHPNVDTHKSVCIGTLEGKNLQKVLENVVDALKTINLNSSFSNEAEQKALELYKKVKDENRKKEKIWST